jgi:hypothetical protein
MEDPSATSTAAPSALVVPQSVAEAMADNVTPVTAADQAVESVTLDLNSVSDASVPGVQVSGSTIRITKPAHYRMTGRWAGQVVVDTDDADTVLTLDGVTIESPVPGALVVEAADRVDIHLVASSVNRVADLGSAPDESDSATATATPQPTPSADSAEAESTRPTAALYSRGDLVIDGRGALTVTSAEGDGIASTDGLVIAGGKLEVEAGDDAIRGQDYVVVTAGTIKATAGGDALKSNNDSDERAGYVLISGGVLDLTAAIDGIDAATDALVTDGELNLNCGDDGIHAETAALVIDGGKVTITKSYEGLEAPVIHIAGGTIDITAADDGVNAAGGDGSAEGANDWAGGGPGGGFPGADGAQLDPGALPSGQAWPDDGEPPLDPGAWPSGQARPGGGRPQFDPGALPTDQAWPGAGDRAPRDPGSLPSDMAWPEDGPGNQRGGGFGGFGGFGGLEGGGAQILWISGGTLRIDAEGDGLDSNGTGSMTGGTVTVYGPVSSGNGALDVGTGLVVEGGTLIAFDGGGMSGSPGAASTQPWLFARLSGASAGSTVEIRSADQTVIGEIELVKRANTLVFSAVDLVAGQTYTILDGMASTLGTATAQ